MKQQTKNMISIGVVGVALLVLIVMTIIPASDEVEVKEISIDPNAKWKDLNNVKYEALTKTEKLEYLKHVISMHETVKIQRDVLGMDSSDQEIYLLALQGMFSNVSKSPADVPEETQEVVEEAQEVQETVETVEETKETSKPETTEKIPETRTIEELKEIRKKLPTSELIHLGNFLGYFDEWEHAIYNERITADEPTSLAVLAERFGITEAEVSQIDSEFSETIRICESIIRGDERRTAREKKEQELAAKREQVQAPEQEQVQETEQANAGTEQAPEQENASSEEEPEQAQEQVPATENETVSETAKDEPEQTEPGEYEKRCALCDNIIPKFPVNRKLCKSCKIDSEEAGMKQGEYIAQELVKRENENQEGSN